MVQYISKDALLAKIEKIYNEDYKFLSSDIADNVQNFKDDLLMNLNTLEVKEVDLEEEIDKELDEEWYGEYIDYDKFRKSAKHFFNLGMSLRNKAQKGD